MEEWGYERNLKLDFFATQSGPGGQGSDLVERMPELFRGFDKRWPQEHSAHCALHRTGADTVQGLLAGQKSIWPLFGAITAFQTRPAGTDCTRVDGAACR
jgi:hypothetical protein